MPRPSIDILSELVSAKSSAKLEDLLGRLPIVDEADYQWDEDDPLKGWRAGRLHWIPIGRERGNAGRIQLAGDPYNPLAERLINGMEAIIELARRLELLDNPGAPMPTSPREAVLRYFDIPRLDLIPRTSDREVRRALDERLRELRKRLELRVEFDSRLREFTVDIRDQGIGQAPDKFHTTLLSLGRSDKPDKPYLIGVFGQGGSSTYFSSKYSIVTSRRAPRVLDGSRDGFGWTIIKKISPRGWRNPYYAYVAADGSGRVPHVEVADLSAAFHPGTSFRHISYDFGKAGSAVARTLYVALNHVLFNPVLPYDLYPGKDAPDAMYGNGYRLSRQTVLFAAKRESVLDKTFEPRLVGERG